MHTNNISNKTIALFFLILFVFGFALSFQYGTYYDEQNEVEIVLQNVNEYLFRLFPSKQAFFVKGIKISESIDRDHGVAIMYPLVPVIIYRQLSLTSAEFLSGLWHTYVYVISFLSVISLYYIGNKIIKNRLFSLSIAAVYFFSPRFFAEMHYNNKDILLLALAIDLLTLVISLADSLNNNEKRRIIAIKVLLTSVVGGFLMNTKIVGIAIEGLFGMLFILLLVQGGTSNKKIFAVSVAVLLLSFAVYFALTPAMWGNSIAFHKYLIVNASDFSRWDNDILFDGEIFRHSTNPLPRTYLLRMILFTTPVYITVLFAIGLVALFCKIIKEKHAFFTNRENLILLFSACEFVIPVLYATIARTHVYNGWRHFYFTYLGFVIIGAYGAFCLYQKCRNKKIIGTVSAICIGFTLVLLVANHPYQHSYYNFLVPDAQESFELDYWNVGTNKAIEKILRDNWRNARLSNTPIYASDYNTAVGISKAVETYGYDGKIQLTTNIEDAQFVIRNKTYGILGGANETEYNSFVLLDVIKSYGNTIYEIYKRI